MIESMLREIMKERCMTVLELSLATEISIETIMRARGYRIVKCRLETLERIACALNVSTKDLYNEYPPCSRFSIRKNMLDRPGHETGQI